MTHYEALRKGAQLLIDDIKGARETLAIFAARDSRQHRRLLARAAMLPGAVLGVRAFLPLYRGWRALRRRLRPAS